MHMIKIQNNKAGSGGLLIVSPLSGVPLYEELAGGNY